MPLRRRPPEPSPRLRALLERAGANDAGGGTGLWQPERAWIASTPSPAADAIPESAAASGERVPAPTPHPGTARTGAAAAGAPRGVVPGRHRRPQPPGPAWLAVPEALRGARLTAPRAAAAGLVLVVLVAGLVFGARVAMARASSEPRPVAPAPTQTGVLTRGSSTFATSATSAGGGGPPTTGTTVTVHVVGQVAHPGIVHLPSGSRVGDAVARAGGALKGADLAAINLARVLVDGEQVRVPEPGEAVVAPPGPGGPGAAGGGAGSSGGGGGAGSPGSSAGVVNLNQATAAQLEDLPGVGPVLAQRIVDWRTEHGRFTTVDELNEVSGIGEKIFAELKPKVTV